MHGNEFRNRPGLLPRFQHVWQTIPTSPGSVAPADRLFASPLRYSANVDVSQMPMKHKQLEVMSGWAEGRHVAVGPSLTEDVHTLSTFQVERSLHVRTLLCGTGMGDKTGCEFNLSWIGL